jgi:peptidoglycan/LPS O-acetylase OafA/YrhL
VHDVVAVALHLAGVPNPGAGTPPPGAAGLLKILKWAAWVVSGLCVFGVFAVAGRMAVMHNRGEGGQHMTGIAYVLGACVLVGAASALVGSLV